MSLRIRVPNAQAASRIPRAPAHDPPTCAQILEQRCTGYQTIQRSCGIQRSQVARPGLEPGTPRFSVVRSGPTEGAQSLETKRFASDPSSTQKSAIYELFASSSGDGSVSSPFRQRLERRGCMCLGELALISAPRDYHRFRDRRQVGLPAGRGPTDRRRARGAARHGPRSDRAGHGSASSAWPAAARGSGRG